MNIPDSFLLKKFYTYSYSPTYKKTDGVYNAGCPVCKEGTSFGKKKRLFFYPKTQTFYCFNCSKSWGGLFWVSEVSNTSINDIKQEILSDSNSDEILFKNPSNFLCKKKQDLPFDSINLSDSSQLDYFNNNEHIKRCISYIEERKLNTAINKCENYFTSFKDFTHKNRLCIPFYEGKKILFYQTRCLEGKFPKYLSKSGGEKSVFNINNVDEDLGYIFITEGPLDSMFIKNGVSIAGLNITELQQKQLCKFPFHKKIWILDNPYVDETAKNKIQELLLKKQHVYMWPLGNKNKDFNEWCINDNTNEINYKDIINSLYPISH
jgi:hypothetical protein